MPTAKNKIDSPPEKNHEIRYRTLFENANDAIFIMDKDVFVECNEKTLEMYNCAREDIIGSTPYNHSPQKQPNDRDSKEMALEKIKAALADNPQRFDWRHRRCDGTEFDAEVSLNKVILNEKTYIMAIVRDLSEIKKSQQTLHSLFHAAPIGIGMVIDRNIVMINNFLLDLLGYEREEVLGKNARILYESDEEYQRVGRIKYAEIEETGSGDIETRFVKKDGSKIDIWLSSTALDPTDLSRGVIFTAMDISQRKQLTDQLKDTIDKYKALVENSNEAIVIMQGNQIKFVNSRATEMFGYSEDEFKELPLEEFIHPEDRTMALSRLESRLKGEKLPPLDRLRLIHKNGDVVWVQNNSTIIEWEGKPASLNFSTDITQKKAAEDRLKLTQRTIDTARVSILWINSEDGRLQYVNEYAAEKFGYTRDELLSMKVSDIDSTVSDERWNELVQNLKQKKSSQMESKFRTSEGKIIPVEIVAYVIAFQEKELVVAFVQDITDRKKALHEIENAKEWAETLVRSAPNIVIGLGEDSEIIIFNDFAADLTGYRPEEVIGKSWIDMFIPDNLKSEIRQIWSGIITNKTIEHTHTNEIVTKDGNRRLIAWNNTFLEENGSFKMILSIGEDITERAKTQAMIEENEEKFRAIFEGALDGIALAKTDTKEFVSVNQTFIKMTGYSEKELLGMTARDIHPKDKVDYVMEQFEKQTRGEIRIATKLPVQRKDGTIIYVDIGSSVVEISDEKYLMGIFRDITEQLEVQEKIQQSEQRFRALFQSAPDAYFILDLQGNFVDGNRAAEELIGYEKQEIVGKNLREIDFLPKKQLPRALKLLAQNALGKDSGPVGFSVIRKDGTKIATEIVSSPIALGDKKLIVGIARNITKRKETEKRSRTIIEEAPFPIMIHAEDGEVLQINKIWTKLTGYAHEDIPTIEQWTEKAYGEQKNVVKEVIDRLFDTGEIVHEGEFNIRTKDGNTQIWDFRTAPLGKLPDGRRQVVSMANNITEEVRNRQEISQAKEQAEKYLNLAGNIIIALDTNGDITLLNKKGYEVLEYEIGELEGKNWFETCLPKKQDPEIRKIFRELMQGNIKGHEKNRNKVITKNNTIKVIDWNNTLLKDDHGNITGLLSSGHDVTDLIRREEQLKISEKRFRELTDLLPQTVFEVDTKGNLLYTNKYAIDRYGYTKEDVENGINALELFAPESHDKLQKNIQSILQGEKVADREYYGLTKDGKKFPVVTYSNPIIENGKPVGIRGIVLDVTELKETEKKLHEKVTELERVNKLMIGRELKMVELKKRLQELERKVKNHEDEEYF